MIWRKTNPAVDPRDEGPRGFDDFEVKLGDILRGERATLGKSLLDVQRELHIRAAHISAIENGDLSAFEAPSFIAGFVRSYARYLDLDPETVYEQFCAEHGFSVGSGMDGQAAPREPRRTNTSLQQTAETAERQGNSQWRPLTSGGAAKPSRQAPAQLPGAIKAVGFLPDPEPIWRRIEPGALGSITILVALIAGLGFAGWTVLQEVQRVQVAPADMMPDVVTDLDPLATARQPVSEMAAAPGLDEDPLSPALSNANSSSGQIRLARPEALEVPQMVPRDGPIAAIGVSEAREGRGETPMISTDAAVAAALADAQFTADEQTAVANGPDDALGASAPRVRDDGPPVVQILAVRPSWMRVRAADGSVVFERILDAGEVWTMPRTEAAPTMHAGNSGSVYFLIDGQAYGPAAPGANVVRNLSLAVADLQDSFEPADMERDQDLAIHVARLQTTEPAAD